MNLQCPALALLALFAAGCDYRITYEMSNLDDLPVHLFVQGNHAGRGNKVEPGGTITYSEAVDGPGDWSVNVMAVRNDAEVAATKCQWTFSEDPDLPKRKTAYVAYEGGATMGCYVEGEE